MNGFYPLLIALLQLYPPYPHEPLDQLHQISFNLKFCSLFLTNQYISPISPQPLKHPLNLIFPNLKICPILFQINHYFLYPSSWASGSHLSYSIEPSSLFYLFLRITCSVYFIPLNYQCHFLTHWTTCSALSHPTINHQLCIILSHWTTYSVHPIPTEPLILFILFPLNHLLCSVVSLNQLLSLNFFH